MIYVTSDLHFFHERPFLYEPRGFTNVYDMNRTIVKNWNEVVNMEDDVYVLGDEMLNNDEGGISLINQLKGNLHLLIGNHTTNNRIEKLQQCFNISDINYIQILKYKKYRFYLSHYPTLTSNWDDDKYLRSRTINLCGHTHCKNRFKDMDKGLIYHCELDAHNNTPISIENIINDLEWFYNLSIQEKQNIIKLENFNKNNILYHG